MHLLTWTILGLLLGVLKAALPHRRFEYKYSFKGPNLVQRDGSIPFWDHGGRKCIRRYLPAAQLLVCLFNGRFLFLPDAIASDESIRITPSLRSKKGKCLIVVGMDTL